MTITLAKVISQEKTCFFCEDCYSSKIYKLFINNEKLRDCISKNLGHFLVVLKIDKIKIKIAKNIEGKQIYQELKKIQSFKKFTKEFLSIDEFETIKSFFNDCYILEDIRAKFPQIILQKLEEKVRTNKIYKQFLFYYKSYSSSSFFQIKKILEYCLKNFEIQLFYLGGHTYKFITEDKDASKIKNKLQELNLVKGEIDFL